MTTTILATFHDLEPAQKLQQRFRQAGIPATVKDESRIQRLWFLSEPLAAVHVEVPVERHLEGRRLLKQLDMERGILRSAVRCPECQSSRIEFPQLTRKFALPGLLGLFMALKLVPREFYCLDCHYTWPVAVALERKRDPFGWPYDSRFWHPENARREKTVAKPAVTERPLLRVRPEALPVPSPT